MPRTPVKFPRTVATRLSVTDGARFTALCDATGKTTSELLRLLVQTAKPTSLPAFVFVAPEESQGEEENGERI